MKNGPKIAIGVTLLFVLAAGGEIAYIHHERTTDTTVKKADYKTDPDDLVFLKKRRPDSMKDIEAYKGDTLWVSAGGQMDYYPFSGGKVDWDHSAGTLPSTQKILVKEAIQAVAPKKTAIRIPTGDKQVLLVFTMPGDAKEYATPVGYEEGGAYTFLADEIFFYDDPHVLFNYWGPQVWAAIDAHKVIPGMSERQAQTSLGQVLTPNGDTVGDRSVQFYNNGHPVLVTFVNDKATSIKDVPAS